MNHILVEHYSGSISYGTNGPSSDIDIRGVFLPSLEDKLVGNYETVITDETHDNNYYELGNFIDLAIKNNPNILETLYVDEKDIIKDSPEYQILRKNRDKFLSKKVVNTYVRYIEQQLHRLKNHKFWIDSEKSFNKELLSQLGLTDDSMLLNVDESEYKRKIKERGLNILDYPMLVKPEQRNYLKIEYNFTSEKQDNKINPELLEKLKTGFIAKKLDGNILAFFEVGGSYSPFSAEGNLHILTVDDIKAIPEDIRKKVYGYPEYLIKYKQEDYEKDLTLYNGFKSWKATRNSKRLELEKSHGYDTKFMMHSMRLIKQCCEILEGKGLIVKRTGIDADYLKDIKAGKYDYEDLINIITSECERAKELAKTSSLPDEPNIDKKELILDISKSVYNLNENNDDLIDYSKINTFKPKSTKTITATITKISKYKPKNIT